MSNSIITAAQIDLQGRVLAQLRTLNLGVNDNILRDIVRRVTTQIATNTVSQVNASAGDHLTSIPNNLIGVNNPVNLVSKNLSSAGLTSVLTNPIQTKIGPGITTNLITSLQQELARSLPPDKLKLINFASFNTSLNKTLTPTINSSIANSLSGFASLLFNNSTPQKPVIQGTEALFSSLSPEEALNAIEEQFASTTANKYLDEAAKFDVNSAENQEKLVVTKVGFVDPTANYPTKEYAGGVETNKLAQGDVRGTVVQKKNNNRMAGAKLPGGDAWSQPESPFKGQYPYNKVTQTESGHVIEIDDTPGAERLHVYHTSGTFIEIDANGSMVRRTSGSSYEIIDKNGKISIAGKADISINGACNIYVGNDASIEVEGDVNLTCHNDITAQAGGTLNLSATEEVNITGGSVNIQAYNYMNVMSKVELNLHSTQTTNMLSNATINVQSVDYYQRAKTYHTQADNFYNYANVSIYNYAVTDINYKLGGNFKVGAGGVINNQAGGVFAVDASQVHLNSGQSSAPSASEESKDAKIAGASNIGVLSGRRVTQYINLTDPSFLTLADAHSLLLEETSSSDSEYKAQQDLVITSGFATAAGFGEKPIVIESKSEAEVKSQQQKEVPASADLKKVTELPGNFKLSPNFTVEMLSHKAAATKDKLQAQQGLTYGEIAFNLQALALNVLEPVYNLYPKMFVTSAFRFPGKNATSQHPLGMAADLQFRGASKSDYYDIAVKLAKVLKYDQMLLEYCNYTNNPWIHISFAPTNRLQVMTFNDHKKYAMGFTNLA